MALVALKLAFAGVARRRLQAALTVVVVAAAAATLTVATGVRDVAGEPWERTWAATRGADAIAMPLSRSAEAAAELNALAQRADVVAATRRTAPSPRSSSRGGDSASASPLFP